MTTNRISGLIVFLLVTSFLVTAFAYPPTQGAVPGPTPDEVNVNFVFRQQMLHREEAEVDYTIPTSQKCHWLMSEPRGYFDIPWGLYEKLGQWCHTPVTLVDYLYQVQSKYTFLKWNATDRTVDAVFLIPDNMGITAPSSLQILFCNEEVSVDGTILRLSPGHDPYPTVVEPFGWEIYSFLDTILVFVSAPLGGDKIVEGPNTTYDFVVIRPCN